MKLIEKDKIKVLFVAHYTDLYGANNSLLQMMLELRDKGVAPTVMLPLWPEAKGRNLVDELNIHGIPYIKAPIRLVKRPSRLKVLLNYLLAISELPSAFKALEGRRFDLVHSNSSTVTTGAYVARRLKVPHVWHLREFGDLDYNLRTPFGKWFQKVLYGGGNTFVAISDKIRSHYKPYVGKQEIRRIYNGVKPMLPRVMNPGKTAVDFCIVGLLQPTKCQLDVLKSADILANERGVRNFRLTIVGDGDAAYTGELKNYIKEKGLEEMVEMTGRIDNVPELLTRMDVGVVASSHEAFGRVTVEYMLAGMAALVSDGGANTEIVDDGTTGLVYRSGDAGNLADRMEMLVKDGDLLRRLAEAGKEHAENNFSSKANSRAIGALYAELLGRKI